MGVCVQCIIKKQRRAFSRCQHSIRYVTVRVSVRPYVSVRLSYSSAAAAIGGFAAVGSAARRYRSIDVRPAPQKHGAQLQMRAVSRLQLTQEAEHRLVILSFIRFSVTYCHI